MENILDITNLAFGGDAVKRLSSVLHESPSATQRGVETALPASLAGLASFASSESKAAELLGAFRGGSYPHVDATEVTRMVGDPDATTRLAQSGQGFMKQLFGGKFSGIADALAGQSGISRSSATTLLGIAAPLVLGAVGKEAAAQNFDARGLARFLGDQGRKVSGLLPASLSSALGQLAPSGEANTQRLREVGGGADEYPNYSATVHGPEARSNPMWLILPLALLVLLGLWLFNRSRAPERQPVLDSPAYDERTPGYGHPDPNQPQPPR